VPHHSNKSFWFPKCSFGKTKIVERSFQPSWFDKWPFLHYDKVSDRVYCQTCTKAFLILIMPASNATSERSFSALRRVKSYLRSTMGQQTLNNLMVLHVHKDMTDAIDLQKISTEFIGDSDHRLKFFGKLNINACI